MANFEPKKLDLDDINGGIRFTESDGVTPNAINDPIEAVAYAQTVVEHLTDTPDTSEINGAGSPNVSFVSSTTADGVTIYKFKFSNLSGATFTPSLDEAGNLSWSNNRNLPNPPTINISGRDYLFSSEVLSGNYIPQVNSEVTDIPLTSFNRAPVDDIDHCYLFYYYTPENIYYWLATQVVDIQKTTATLKILSVVRLTGYTPTIGKNGNWVINGEDTGKPSYGASGVTNVVAGASYNQDDFTVTPLTFNFEVGNSKTVNVKAAIGNVEDGSYAKLTQVVRVDTAQSLTETKKKTFAANMGKPYGNKYSGGWMKMAVLKRTASGASALYAVFLISSSNNPMAYGLLKVSTYATPSALYDRSIELISLSSNGLNPSVIRGVYDNSDNSITIYVKGSDAYNSITLQTISNYGLEPFDITIDPENVTTEPTANITCTWGRIEAGSFVQDGHSVALQDGTYEDMTVGNAKKATQDANGNVIDETYAKLSQVVRTDSEQSLSAEQKRQFQINVGSSTKISSPPTQIGWYNIATIPNASLATLEISEGFWNRDGGSCFAFLSLGYYRSNISTIASGGNRAFTKIRTRLIGTTYYIDIYNNTTSSNTCRISMTAYPAVNMNTIITPQTPTFVGVDDNPTNASNIEIVDINAPVDPGGGRMSTSGTIYSNGSPVLVGSASSESGTTGTNGGLTLPSAGWYYIQYTIISTVIVAVDYATGVFYWDGSRHLLLPVSYFSEAKASRCVSIGANGVIKVYDADTGDELKAKIIYYKLA